MFKKETVYMGYSMEELAMVRSVLGRNQIAYKVKTKNPSGEWFIGGSRRGTVGSAGMNADYERQYEVFVAPEDAEQARYLINEEKHRQ